MKKNIAIGILSGIFAPMIIVILIYVFKYSEYTLYDYLETSYHTGTLEKIFSLGAVLNLGLFVLCMNYLRIRKPIAEYWARGIFFATLAWGVAIVYLKFFV